MSAYDAAGLLVLAIAAIIVLVTATRPRK